MAKYNMKVFGVGGGGSNTIDYIKSNDIENIKTYAINTDDQALKQSKADFKIHLGKNTTKGLGAGALPEIGRKAAEESKDEIIHELQNTDILFIAAGMGGGTGTGAAPYIANLAKQMGILTIGVVTKPFKFEGISRTSMALEGISLLNENSDVTIVIPNEKLILNHKDKFMEEAFVLPDEVLQTAIVAIVSVLENYNKYGSNIDLNDLKEILSNKGLAVMGIGKSNDDEKNGFENTLSALNKAITSEILEISVHGAKTFIVLITANLNHFMFDEISIVETHLQSELGYKIKCNVMPRNDESLNEIERDITLIAVDYENQEFVEKIIQKDFTSSDSNDIFSGL